MDNGGIYLLTSPSGKVYVGQSQDIDQRFYDYKHKPSKNQVYLYNALKKHGFDAFDKTILFLSNDPAELNKLEVIFIALYDSRNKAKGYNIREGGKNGKLSEESRQKISAALLGRRCSPKTEFKKGERASPSTEFVAGQGAIPIEQYSLEGDLIKKWKSIDDASSVLSIPHGSISACLRGRAKTGFGFKWEYESKTVVILHKRHNNPKTICFKKAVKRIALDSGEEKLFASVKEAAAQSGIKYAANISICLKGKITQCGGYKWEYQK